MNQSQPWFLHVDLDAFFASVEQLDNPQYRGKPLIVGGLPGDKRSVVSTASYEARVFGVHSAMPIYQAYRLCPQGIYVRGRMRRYAELSYHIMNILKEYSPDVNQMSIDEAFIDITGTEKLFGPPKETALKIKKRIKDETALTVSVGMAPSKYLAKIASDINKPDGFYCVEPGMEKDFMLSLPLKKVFGIGNKSIEALNSKGLRTTRSIYEQPLEVLTFMFGKNQGTFLFNAVRGIETGTFDREAKSHSISAETTFINDIYDIYTAETKLLELCHGIMFRLIKEECFSRTVMIKLRYEDFTTVTIQRTYDKNIRILDDLYDKAKDLLEEKYIKGKGIRLLGIAFENIETEEKSVQLELFDDGSEKKQAIEKAIINLEKKHPEIKIHKARVLEDEDRILIKKEKHKQDFDSAFAKIKSLLLFLFMLLSLCKFPQKVYSSEVESKGAAGILTETQEENPPAYDFTELLNLSRQNNNSNYNFSGYYKFGVDTSFFSTFGFETTPAAAFSTPVIKQEIDLSSLIKITDSWYFYLDFLDNFNKNTYTLGYKNNQTYFNQFYFSNRNIRFPSIYATEKLGYIIGGGENQAPGFLFHFYDFERNRWNADFVFRYDITETKDAVFYGKNQVNDIKLQLENYIRGRFFVIPGENFINAIKDVYVENPKGNYTDSSGRKYKKLNATEYFIDYKNHQLILSQSDSSFTEKSVLITFSSADLTQNFISSIGNYNQENSFLGKTQSYFRKSNPEIDLKKYAFNIETNINKEKAVIIQSPSGFSPFLNSSWYDCGLIKNAEISLISDNTQMQSELYEVDFSSENFNSAENYMFYENKTYAKVYTKNSGSDILSPEVRFPFADINPDIYLSRNNNTDLVILLRTFSSVSNFDIGKKAAAGTVKVYINGILEPNITYESDSGFVTLGKSISDTDKIYITWQEDSSDLLHGAFSSAAGLEYKISDAISLNLSLANRWPMSPFTKYADSLSSQNGFSSLAGNFTYSKNNFTFENSTALSVQSENSTGIYVVSTQKNIKNETFYQGISNGYFTKVIPKLNTEFSSPELTTEGNFTLLNHTGITDSDISGYKIPLSFDFSSAQENQLVWASMDIKLSEGSLLSSCSELEFALKNSQNLTGYDVYLQLGIKAEKDFTGENTDTIPTWKISSSEDSKVTDSLDLNSTQWQTIKILLDHKDRSKLLTNNDARLIIVNTSLKKSHTLTGTIFAGPYEPLCSAGFTSHTNAINVSSFSTEDSSSPAALSFMKEETNYSTKVNWNITDTNLSEQDNLITYGTLFSQASFANYDYINLDFSYVKKIKENAATNDNPALKLILDTDAESLTQDGKIALSLELSPHILEKIIDKNEIWHQLKINTNTKEVLIDDELISSAFCTLYINKNIIPTREKIIFNTNINGNLITNGSLILGNLYYTGINPYFTAKNKISAQYKKNGDILKIKDFSLIQDAYLNIDSNQNYSFDTDSFDSHSLNINSTFNSQITFANLKFETDGKINYEDNNKSQILLNNAGHSVTTQKSLLDIFSISENYRFAPDDNSLEKRNSATLNLQKIKLPATLSLNSHAKQSFYQKSSDFNSDFKLNFKILDSNFSFNTAISANQKIKTSQIINENYFTSYADLFLLEFSKGEDNASNRDLIFSSSLLSDFSKIKLKPAIFYELSNTYSDTNITANESKAKSRISIPFTIFDSTFNFTYEKSSGGTIKTGHSPDYIMDAQNYLSFAYEQKWFYFPLPLADLWSSSIAEDFLKSENDSAFYSSSYSLNYSKKLSNSLKDFIIPHSVLFTISRDIKGSTSISDLYQIKTTVSNISLNIFGSKGLLPLFNFYETDEYTFSLSSAIKIPANHLNESELQLSTYGSMIFYISEKNIIQSAVDFVYDTNSNYQFRITSFWSRPSNFSLLSFIPPLIFKNLEITKLSILRKDSANFTLGYQNLIHNAGLEYSHKCDLTFLKNYSLTTDLKLIFSYTQNTIFRLGTEVSIGGKIAF